MQKTANSDVRKWTDKKRFILPLLIFLFPVGLYFLWKSNGFSKEGKIGLSIGFGLFFFMYVAGVLVEPKNQNNQVVDNNLPDRVDMVAEEVATNTDDMVQFDANGKKVEVVEEEVNSQDNKTNDEVNVEEMTDLERARLIQENPKTQWAMKLVQGEKWDFNKITKKLGNNYEVIQPTQLNPNIVKAYYFPDANVTLFHNSMKGTFYFLRIGKASE